MAHFRGAEGNARHPGERTLQTRERSRREGVEVDERVWRQLELC